MTEVEIICLGVVIVVVFFYALAFFLSFRRSSYYQRKAIHGQDMDDEISEFLINTDGAFYDSTDGKEDEAFYPDFIRYREKRMKKEKRANIWTNIITVIFYILVAALFATGIYLKATGEQMFIGSHSYLVVETGSMSKKNTSNEYLFNDDLNKQYKLDNQIDTFDLIQLEKVNSASDIKLYDVVAYKAEDGSIVIHRVIELTTSDDGTPHFRFRGDSNSSSSEYEYHGHDKTGKGLTMDDIVGKYTNWSNFGLGLFIQYIRSDIGMVCLASAVIVIIFYYYFDDKNLKHLDRREALVAKRINAAKVTRYKWYQIKYRQNKSYKKLTKGIDVDPELE